MFKEFFDMEGGEVVINEHILNIPALRAVKETYKDPMPALKFLRYRYDPRSPYCDEPEENKDEIVLQEFPGEYTLEDEVMITAIEWLQARYMTSLYRFYLNNKRLLEKMGEYAATAEIVPGRDGNMSALQRQLMTVGKTTMEFRQLEKAVDQEIEEMNKTRNRGGVASSYDES
jgi:hypothetical protein